MKKISNCFSITLTGIFLSFLFFGIKITPAQAAPQGNNKVCFCHNIDEDVSGGDKGEICVSFNAFDDLTTSNHWNHYLCFLRDSELCDNVGPNHPDCDFLPPDPDSCPFGDTRGLCNGCGNGILEAGEECDDGDNDSFPSPGDTCDANCQIICDSNADCADDRDCTVDTCESGTCQHNVDACECSTADDCDLHDPCTTETCVNEKCQSDIDVGQSCSNGLFCDGEETCNELGNCEAAAPADCSDTDSCTVDACNVETDSCENITDNSIQGCQPPGAEAECVDPNGITGSGISGCGGKCSNLLTGSFDPMVVGIWTSMLMGPTVIAGILRRKRR